MQKKIGKIGLVCDIMQCCNFSMVTLSKLVITFCVSNCVILILIDFSDSCSVGDHLHVKPEEIISVSQGIKSKGFCLHLSLGFWAARRLNTQKGAKIPA